MTETRIVWETPAYARAGSYQVADVRSGASGIMHRLVVKRSVRRSRLFIILIDGQRVPKSGFFNSLDAAKIAVVQEAQERGFL